MTESIKEQKTILEHLEKDYSTDQLVKLHEAFCSGDPRFTPAVIDFVNDINSGIEDDWLLPSVWESNRRGKSVNYATLFKYLCAALAGRLCREYRANELRDKMTMICLSCDANIDPYLEANYCPYCGSKFFNEEIEATLVETELMLNLIQSANATVNAIKNLYFEDAKVYAAELNMHLQEFERYVMCEEEDSTNE